MRWHHFEGFETAFETAAEELNGLLDKYQGKRGFVHVSSYEQAHRIAALCDNPRLIVHCKEDKLDALEMLFTRT